MNKFLIAGLAFVLGVFASGLVNVTSLAGQSSSTDLSETIRRTQNAKTKDELVLATQKGGDDERVCLDEWTECVETCTLEREECLSSGSDTCQCFLQYEYCKDSCDSRYELCTLDVQLEILRR